MVVGKKTCLMLVASVIFTLFGRLFQWHVLNYITGCAHISSFNIAGFLLDPIPGTQTIVKVWVDLAPGARVRPSTNHWVSYQPTIGFSRRSRFTHHE